MCTRSFSVSSVRALALAAGLVVLVAGPWGGWSVAQEGSIDTSGIATEVHIDDEGVQVRSKNGTQSKKGVHIKVATDKSMPPVPEPPAPPNIDITVGDDNANDIVRFGSDITIHAGKKVDGSVVAIGGKITVLGEVMEDVVSIGGGIEVKPSGVIHGDAVAVGGAVNSDVGSTIGGEDVSIGFGALKLLGFLGLLAGIGSFGAAVGLLLVLVMIGIIALVLARTRMERMLAAYDHNMGRFFLSGFLWTIAFGPLFILLLVTVIGIPVAILLPFVYALAYLVGVSCSGMYLGRRLRPHSSLRMAALIGIGVLVLVQWCGGWMSETGWLKVFGWVLSLLGFFGWLWAFFTGLGAVWVTRFGDVKRTDRMQSETATPQRTPPASESPVSAATSERTESTVWEAPATTPVQLPGSSGTAPEAEPNA